MPPFYANYGYHSRATLKIHPSQNYENPAEEAYIDCVQQVHKKLPPTLEQVQKRYKENFDKKAAWAPKFKVEDLI